MRQTQRRQVLFVLYFIVGVFLWIFRPQIVLLNDEELKKQNDIEFEDTTGTADIATTETDACLVSDSIKQNPLSIKTYFRLDPVSIPNDSVAHVSLALCATITDDTTSSYDSPLKSIFAFKAARTGSTFFTKVITSTIKHTGHPTSKYWEPYARRCNGTHLAPDQQEDALRALMTTSCAVGRSNRSLDDKCVPDKWCIRAKSNETVFISATNPRFLNPRIDWRRVVDPATRLFSLRRTNLVLMSYSKYHHGGCPIDEQSNTGGGFTLETLVRCAEHYALNDQEYSSSVAWHTATATDHDPFLAVYEDVTTNGALVQKGIIEFLGLNITSINIFEEESQTRKKHTNNLCDYPDVNCESLVNQLGRDYPCLWKQLRRAEEGRTWTVPMLENGTISIRGDCKTLPPLTDEYSTRDLRELYQLPHS